MNYRYLLLNIRKNLMPNNVVQSSKRFTRFANPLRLTSPYFRVTNGNGHTLFDRTSVHNKVHKRRKSTDRVLGHLMDECIPLVIRPIRITRMPNRAEARTGGFVDGLIRALYNCALLRSRDKGRLLIGNNINLHVDRVRRLDLRLVNERNLRGRSLLFNSSQRVRRQPAARRTTQDSNCHLLYHTFKRLSIGSSTVTHNYGQYNVSRNIISVTRLGFHVQVYVRQTMLHGVNVFRKQLHVFIADRYVGRRVITFTILRLISRTLTFNGRRQ